MGVRFVLGVAVWVGVGVERGFGLERERFMVWAAEASRWANKTRVTKELKVGSRATLGTKRTGLGLAPLTRAWACRHEARGRPVRPAGLAAVRYNVKGVAGQALLLAHGGKHVLRRVIAS